MTAGAAPAPQAAPEVGDFAPNFSLPAHTGQIVLLRSDQIAGKPVLLLFCPKEVDPPTRTIIESLRRSAPELRRLGAEILLIRDATPPENAAAVEAERIDFPIVSDPDDRLRAVYGLARRRGAVAILLTANQRIAAISGEETAGAAALDPLLLRLRRDEERRHPVLMAPHPPVLIVPDVLSAQECRHLIALWEAEGTPMRTPGDHLQETGNYKIEINDYGRVDRIDFVVQDKATMALLTQRIGKRVLPEILKAFQYPVSRRERFHIARYEGARGGFQHGHRDNPTAELAHRRFALSLNLNTEEYEGGELRFPEFGDQRYRVERGAALVFSSSLLHEVLEVRSGTRYVLLSHFYGTDAGRAGQMR
jgi:peroxiredoxin